MAFRTNKMPVLQEKSASGAVATFNTALAMPLASCNIAVNAWQEGSGDPSPSNVRAIHGFDTVHVNMANFNQYINEKTDYDTPQTVNGVTISRNGNAFTFSGDCVTASGINLNNNSNLFTPMDIYLAICFKSNWEGENDNWGIFKIGTGTNIYGGNSEYRIFRLPSNWSGGSWNMRVPLVNGKHYDFTFYPQVFNLTQMFGSKLAEQILTAEQGQAGSGYAMFRQLFYKSWYNYNEGGTWVSVASVNGDSYPDYAQIQLGQEVYGAEVDVVNGVARVDKKIKELTGQFVRSVSTIVNNNFIKSDATNIAIPISEIYPSVPLAQNSPQLCDMFNWSSNSIWTSVGYPNTWNINNNNMHINIGNNLTGVVYETDDKTTAKAKLLSWFDNNTVKCVIPIEPFDIQLTPTQIETLIGNNTIFADTGDVDLTYKDLDIAKRGNFREVFKLPS